MASSRFVVAVVTCAIAWVVVARARRGGVERRVDVVARNVYARGARVDVRACVSARETTCACDERAQNVVTRMDVRLGVDSFAATATSDGRDALASRSTLQMDVLITPVRFTRDLKRREGKCDDEHALRASVEVMTYEKARRKGAAKRRLLRASDDARTSAKGGEGEDEEEDEASSLVGYWKPNVTLSVVDDFNAYRVGTIPDVLARRMRFANEERSAYYPTVYFNEFWTLKSHLVPVNDTNAHALEVTLNFAPLSALQWQMQESATLAWRQHVDFGAADENDAEHLKRIFLEGNPVLLVITAVVSVLHTAFDMLAFKSDVAFWSNVKSMQGLSARSVSFNAAMQLIIFLYLLDNETSWMILFSSGTGTLIEFWKVTKAMDVSVERGGGHSLPRLRIKHKESSSLSDTAKHDADAMRVLSYALYPMCAIYAAYDLHINEHKGWYSFIISSLVGSIYVFGFIAMTPQLYINYKLKSVAAMPWKQMSYKFLNTIIDDLFAFVIKMPTLHRISVFRDDIIFLLFLYQRRIYRVDASRVNEFGWSGAVADADALELTNAADEFRDDSPLESKKDR